MNERLKKSSYLIITGLLCLTIILNFFFWQSPLVGLLGGAGYLIFLSFIFGSIFIAKKAWSILFGLLFLFSLIAILGALFIYFLNFGNYTFLFLLIILPAGLATPYYYFYQIEKISLTTIAKDYWEKFSQRKESKFNLIFVIFFLLITGFNFFLLFRGQTTESIQSPWQTVSDKFIPLYFLSTIILLIYLFKARRTKLPLLLLAIYAFLSSSVALIIYQIGYGFDPFIHQATEKIINETGTIQPKPLYYLGQYGLVIFLHKLTFIDLDLIDRLLVPCLFSLWLVPIAFYTFSHWYKKNYALILALLTLAVPYGGFIMTAPQNLANLIFILTILISLLYYRNQMRALALYLLAGAALAIHPMAGIPLTITVILLQLFKIFHRRGLLIYFLAGLIFSLVLPLAFLAHGSGLISQWPDWKKSDFLLVNWVDKYDLTLNLAYLWQQNEVFVAGLIIACALVYLAKKRLLKNNLGYLTAGGVVLVDYYFIKYFLTFPDLQTADRYVFVSRLAWLAFYILLPLFLLGLHQIIKKFWPGDWWQKIFLVFILAGSLTISFYFSYPRFNNYEPAEFFSISASDLKTVNFIEQTASPDHIVLANQMIGASAIKEFGFKKYYANQFYYSMPMGSPQTLYQHYLEMVYQGSKKETMFLAMDEAGVNEAYFVLNQYWNNSEVIKKQAAATAYQIYEIDNGKVYIFKYTK